jgi:hypothetical protein
MVGFFAYKGLSLFPSARQQVSAKSSQTAFAAKKWAWDVEELPSQVGEKNNLPSVSEGLPPAIQ